MIVDIHSHIIPPVWLAALRAKGDIEGSKEIVSSLTGLLDTAMGGIKDAQKALIEAANAIETAQGWGFNTSELESRLERARQTMEEGALEYSVEQANAVIEDAKNLRQTHKDVSDALAKLQKNLAHNPEVSTRLEEAESEFYKGNYSRAKSILENLDD